MLIAPKLSVELSGRCVPLSSKNESVPRQRPQLGRAARINMKLYIKRHNRGDRPQLHSAFIHLRVLFFNMIQP